MEIKVGSKIRNKEIKDLINNVSGKNSSELFESYRS